MGFYGNVAAGRHAERNAGYNADIARLQGRDALRRGQDVANQLRQQGRSVQGRQVTSLAAQGVSLDSEDAGVLVEDTRRMAAADAERALHNATREQWGYEKQAEIYEREGRYARRTSYTRAFSSLLGDANSLYNMYSLLQPQTATTVTASPIISTGTG